MLCPVFFFLINIISHRVEEGGSDRQTSLLQSAASTLESPPHPPTKRKDPHEGVRKKKTVQFVLRNTEKINHSIYFLALFTEKKHLGHRGDHERLWNRVGNCDSEWAGTPQWPLVKQHGFPRRETITRHEEVGARETGV